MCCIFENRILNFACSSKKFIIFWVSELATGLSSMSIYRKLLLTCLNPDTVIILLTVIRSYQLREAEVWRSRIFVIFFKYGTSNLGMSHLDICQGMRNYVGMLWLTLLCHGSMQVDFEPKPC